MRKPASEAYLEKLRDSRWQKKRLKIFERDGWQCRRCSSGEEQSVTLHVHHLWYEEGEPWEVEENALMTLCAGCHEDETATRREEEQSLLAILRECRILSSQVQELMMAFDLTRGFIGHPFTWSAMCQFIQTVDRERLEQWYLDYLAERRDQIAKRKAETKAEANG